eukprot:gene27940-31562_t
MINLFIPTLISFLFVTGFLLSNIRGEQPVDLGDAELYAVLADSTITNTGSTVITGSVGLSPGTSITGFPPATYDGTLDSNNPAAAAAQTALNDAYTILAAKPYNTDLTSQNLGGMTLTPGVYKFTAEAVLTGVLTLDASGDAYAVW